MGEGEFKGSLRASKRNRMKGRAAVKAGCIDAVEEPCRDACFSLNSPTPMKSVRLAVFDQRMIGRDAARGRFQAAAVEVEKLAEVFIVPHAPPADWPIDDRLPDLRERAGVGPPHSHRQKTFARLDVDVETGGVDVAAGLVPELDAGVRLVRAALEKPSVPIDPQQRSAHSLVGGREKLRNFLQSRPEGRG